MQPYGIPAGRAGTLDSVSRNKVLRNTYGLLGLSMIPTAIGAMLGISLQFHMSPMMGLLVFMGVAFGSMFLIEKNKNNSMGVVLLLGFTFFMGLWLSQLLQVALRFPNGAQSIALAAGGTGVTFLAMSTIATVSKRDFSSLGKFLFIGLIVALVAGIANIWLQLPALALTLSAAMVVISSLYMLYDVSRVVNGGETNYISAALAIYLDIYNLFQNLLFLILSLTGNSRD
ncbi:Bax inhibitor-1/YccA family protein [Leeia sp. TBRC 13508]|uniref:Bax inhibitor-1/YccA family protein n=1 Tax=Leeia speluncae TaxID=2884804 RepID=A0ABS8D3Q2_9NEIS|nr:Bax inhibitor-1/YccA family protein [Leeia speluncae]MCB6182820.1 Bax inhibitor-1/YccA family protein [Leeia speluncae]